MSSPPEQLANPVVDTVKIVRMQNQVSHCYFVLFFIYVFSILCT
jgi:hypothetical protein